MPSYQRPKPPTIQRLPSAPRKQNRWQIDNPVRLVPVGFLVAVLLGAGLLMLPVARTGPSGADPLTAVFTAVSAVCVTGLITVDTATYWTPFGQLVILGLIQIGGFGIMTLGTLLALLVRRKLGLRGQLMAATETRSLNLGDVRHVLLLVAKITIGIELAVAVVLSVRFWATGHDIPRAIYTGVFHAISAFNNAGFSTYSDSLMGFVDDPWIIIPICVAIVCGGLGFPVMIELLRRNEDHRGWALHTRLTVWGTAIMLALGFLALASFEWNRSETLGHLSPGGKILGALGLTVFPRTAGFNSIDYADASSESLLVTDMLMFIGGGSAGTAGGIKVTTFLVLAFALWSQIRGHEQVTLGNRAIGESVQRQALSVVLLGIGAVLAGMIVLLRVTSHTVEEVLFECVSAFATVGLSMGITGDLPPAGQWVIILLMFGGRVGMVTVATALALRSKMLMYRLPEERPIIG
ncbi:potassium transporter TrkG [Glutamicibacter endophyticus]